MSGCSSATGWRASINNGHFIRWVMPFRCRCLLPCPAVPAWVLVTVQWCWTSWCSSHSARGDSHAAPRDEVWPRVSKAFNFLHQGNLSLTRPEFFKYLQTSWPPSPAQLVLSKNNECFEPYDTDCWTVVCQGLTSAQSLK